MLSRITRIVPQWLYRLAVWFMTRVGASQSARYGVASLTVLLALLLMLLVNPWVSMVRSPFLLFFAAVMVSAWYGGIGPGIWATVLSLLSSYYFFFPPLHSWSTLSLDDSVRMGLFGLVSLMISVLTSSRRRLITALRKERDFSSAIVNTAGSLIMVLDRHGNIVQFNRTCEDITGYTWEEVAGTPPWKYLIPDQEIHAFRQAFQSLRMGIFPGEYEGDWLLRDGSRRRIAWSNTVLFDDHGQVSYIIATGIDVTAREQAERELQASNQTLEALIHASPLAISVLDRQGQVKRWNPAAEQIFGWTAAEAIGQFMPSVQPHKRSEFLRNIQATLDGEFQNGMEVSRQRKDGSTVYISLWAAVLQDANGEECILSVVADVSDRRRAEDALKLTQAKLTSFVEANIIGILFGDTHGGIEDANDEFLRIVGYSRAELQAGQLRWTEMTPTEYLLIDDERMAEAEARGACTPYEKEYFRKDGSRVPVLVGYTLMESSYQSVAFVLDLTERKRLEQTLQRQTQELTQANRMKDEFLAVLSHELRTPMNSILGWSQLLQKRRIDEVTTRRALETIERNARLQSQLIEDILDVAKVIQGKLRLHFRPIFLPPVIAAAVDAMRPAANAKQVQLDVILDPTVGQVYGDPDRLQQVIWNLVSNAIKFTPEGGRVTVRLAAIDRQQSRFPLHQTANGDRPELPKKAAQIIVTDTGRGISAEFLPFVFDRFRQADSSTTRISGGLGLGLAIVRHLVELHGGTVEAASPGLNQGATFTVTLPLFVEPPREDSQPKRVPEWAAIDETATLQQRSTIEPTGQGQSLQSEPLLLGVPVLVVDDEPDTCEFLRVALEQSGAVVTIATSATAALSVVTQHQMAVLVSDIAMPYENGYTLIERIRQLPPPRGHIPAIALTAYAREEDRRQALAAGFQKHLTKPVDPFSLVLAVAALANRLTQA